MSFSTFWGVVKSVYWHHKQVLERKEFADTVCRVKTTGGLWILETEAVNFELFSMTKCN